MKVFTTDNIRNISLLGHRGSGKTTLIESILYVKDYIKRKGDVENGTTVSDFDKEEIRRIFSINTSLIPVEHNNVKLNFLDTPGYFDFVGEVISSLRVSASAVLVLDATAGVEVGTEKAWKLLEERKLPRIIFVNKMDKGYVNYTKLLTELKEKFGKKIAPFCIPIGEKDEFKGFINVVDMVGRVFDGKECVDTPIPDDVDVSEVRNLLFEAIAETDEALMDKYFAGEEFTQEEIVKGLHKGVVNGDIVPVMVGSAQQNIGIHTLLNYLDLYMPCPTELFSGQRVGEDPITQQEKVVKISDENPFSAIVFKTLVDPFIGKITFFKVNSGVLRKETEVFNPKKNKKENMRNSENDTDQNYCFFEDIPIRIMSILPESLCNQNGHGCCHRTCYRQEDHAGLRKNTDGCNCACSERANHDNVGIAQKNHKDALKRCGQSNSKISSIIGGQQSIISPQRFSHFPEQAIIE